jgi:hypothetical protein
MIVSNEADDFVREIQIDSEATFLDFHKAILKAVNYVDDQMCSFFVCDEDWNKETEITRVEMDTSSEEDNYTMEATHLEDLIEDEGQRLLYVFDFMTERAFFIELRETIPNKSLKEAVCSRSNGNPPAQNVDFDKMAEVPKGTTEEALGENFYGDSEYDEDELDHEGFEGLDNIADDYYEENRY